MSLISIARWGVRVRRTDQEESWLCQQANTRRRRMLTICSNTTVNVRHSYSIEKINISMEYKLKCIVMISDFWQQRHSQYDFRTLYNASKQSRWISVRSHDYTSLSKAFVSLRTNDVTRNLFHCRSFHSYALTSAYRPVQGLIQWLMSIIRSQ